MTTAQDLISLGVQPAPVIEGHLMGFGFTQLQVLDDQSAVWSKPATEETVIVTATGNCLIVEQWI